MRLIQPCTITKSAVTFVLALSLFQHGLQTVLLGLRSIAGAAYMVMAGIVAALLALEVLPCRHHKPAIVFCACLHQCVEVLFRTLDENRGHRVCGLLSLEQILSFVSMSLLLAVKDIPSKHLIFALCLCGTFSLGSLVHSIAESCVWQWHPALPENLNMLSSWAFSICVTGAIYARKPKRMAVIPWPGLTSDSVSISSPASSVSERYAPNELFDEGEAEERRPHPLAPATCTSFSSEKSRRPVLRMAPADNRTDSFDSVMAVQNHGTSTCGASVGQTSFLDDLYEDMATNDALTRLYEEVSEQRVHELLDDDILS